MKTISKKNLILTLVLASVLVVSTSAKSMAIDGEGNAAGACIRISTLASTNDAAVTEHMSLMKTNFANRLTEIASRQAEVDQKAATFRTNIAAKFDKKVSELKQQSGLTTDQLTAIDTYATNMKSAEATREAAVDAARSTYRTALAETISAHQQSLLGAATAFEAASTAAFATAQADCSTAAMTTLKETIKTARETLTSVRESSKVGQTVKQLADTRNAAIKAADEAFAKSAADYTAILKAVFIQ